MTDLNRIFSSDNEKIKLYRKLSEDKKARRKENKFTIEGARLVSDAAAEAIELHSVFFTEAALEKYGEALELLFEKYPPKIFNIISEELSRELSETKMPQGIFAVCSMPDTSKNDIYRRLAPGSRVLILDNIQDPGNMGTMLRTADACGIDCVITCSCCDIYNPKTVRSAMGSVMRVPIISDDIIHAAEEIKLKGIPLFAAVISDNAFSLTECDFSGGGAVIIGNEGSGLSPEDAALADVLLTIKMHGTINSLNAAMAAGIIMWELSKRREE
ncbi:MAG: RNA methyltransferase [Oscillospiraceae bacterium]|nr:RNA methyltransferase [Oscillospiraceae bacterium]